MSNYDVEREKQESADIRKAFRECFPLAAENDLPWAACQIKGFLRERIKREVEEGTRHFTSRVVRVLCDISPPKTHVEDMARIVVNEAKKVPDMESEIKYLKEQIEKLKKPKETPAANAT